ncbi:MAG: hypothetical protein V5A20_06355 [Salinibacter sp.]|uniref:hypothetical protein n=1 Tax=Salinibacter sp. TaxID=2065818 RepID=UPI002FC2DAB6
MRTSAAMTLADRLSLLRARAEGQRAALDRQKQTETALVLPFFDALGYDPFDVRNVEPEAGIDGEDEVVDYVLKRDETPVMLVECTEATGGLDELEEDALFGHAEAMGAPIVVFTNGLQSRFYAVPDGNGGRPEEPVLAFDLLDHTPGDVDTLRQFARPVFDEEEIRGTAHSRVRSRQLREYLVRQKDAPDVPFVRFVATQVCGDSVSEDELDRLRPVVQNVLDELLEETQNERTPLSAQKESPVPPNGEAVSNREAAEQKQTGVFEKDIVKRVLDEF